jgi:hypothetical protein
MVRPDPGTILYTVELIQERKTGDMDEDIAPAVTSGPAGQEFDIFIGDKSGQLPFARIKSSASKLEPPQKEKKSGLFGCRQTQPRRSIIPEVI